MSELLTISAQCRWGYFKKVFLIHCCGAPWSSVQKKWCSQISNGCNGFVSIQNEALTLVNIYKEISSLEIKLIEIAQTN